MSRQTIFTIMKSIAASWDEPYSYRSPINGMVIWQRNRSKSWHRLMQQRAKRGFVRHYVRGI